MPTPLDMDGAGNSQADRDTADAWLGEHPDDEVHVYVYDGDSGECVQTIIMKGVGLVPSSITCPVCGMTSHHPDDIREGYCGKCHAWTGRLGWP